MRTGTGTRLAAEIGAIVERTLNWIAHDMDRKIGIGSPSEQTSSLNNAQDNTSTPLGSETPNGKSGTSTTTNGNAFYDSALAGSAAPYPSLGYDNSTVNGGPVGPSTQASQQNGTPEANFDPTNNTPYQLYTTAGGASGDLVPTPTLPSNVTTSMDQTGASVTNPLVAFASQAPQHVMTGGPGSQPPAPGHPEDDWRRTAAAQQLLAATAQNSGMMTGNTWHEWAAAIVENQDRFSANTLLTLGGRTGDNMQQIDGGQNDAINAGLVSLGVGLPPHTGPWPLLLFPDGTSSGGG